MNWQYLRSWSCYYLKKSLFNTVDQILSAYTRIIIIFYRCVPQCLQKNVLFYCIEKLSRFGLLYLYYRSLHTHNIDLFQKSANLSDSLLGRYRFTYLKLENGQLHTVALVKNKIIQSYISYPTPSKLRLRLNLKLRARLGLILPNIIKKISLKPLVANFSKYLKFFYFRTLFRHGIFLSELQQGVEFFVIDEMKNTCFPVEIKGRERIEIPFIYDDQKCKKYNVISEKILDISFSYCSDLDFYIATILASKGRSDCSHKLLQQIEISNPAYLLKIAKQYFDLGYFERCNFFLQAHFQHTSLDQLNIGKVLQIVDPRKCNESSWYKTNLLASSKEYQFSLPAVFPHRMYNIVDKKVSLPPEQIFELKNAEIYCGNIVVGEDKFLFLYEPAAYPSFEFVAGNWSHIYGSHLQLNHCILYTNYQSEREVDEAILIDGRCSNNYFHWLVEYLARLHTINKNSEISQLPLIVDETMLPASKQALQIVFPNAHIIWNNKQTKLKVKNLYIPSFHTFHPDHMQLPFWKISGLSSDHLAFIRDAAYRQANIAITPFRKIYLKRSSSLRGLTNFLEVEKVLQEFDFETVDPATLSFIEQVELFASAKYIVGVGGAAFTNLMFCQPGCIVIGLISKQLEDFCMQSNIAAFAGCKFVYLSGIPQLNLQNWISLSNNIHANFAINPNKLRTLLKNFN